MIYLNFNDLFFKICLYLIGFVVLVFLFIVCNGEININVEWNLLVEVKFEKENMFDSFDVFFVDGIMEVIF